MPGSRNKVLGVIPARYASTRLPGKPLAMIGSQSMVMRVYARASEADGIDYLVVATDDHRILEHVKNEGGQAVMTREAHPSGTARCLEALEKVEAETGRKFDVVVNIQGDEPFLEARDIETLLSAYDDGYVGIASLCSIIDNPSEILNPNVVKVVTDARGNALYFSRSPIPYVREKEAEKWGDLGLHRKHLGIYAYSALTLREIDTLPSDRYELAESLEQLRWLAAGIRIRMLESNSLAQGIDSEEDLAIARKRVETEE